MRAPSDEEKALAEKWLLPVVRLFEFATSWKVMLPVSFLFPYLMGETLLFSLGLSLFVTAASWQIWKDSSGIYSDEFILRQYLNARSRGSKLCISGSVIAMETGLSHERVKELMTEFARKGDAGVYLYKPCRKCETEVPVFLKPKVSLFIDSGFERALCPKCRYPTPLGSDSARVKWVWG